MVDFDGVAAKAAISKGIAEFCDLLTRIIVRQVEGRHRRIYADDVLPSASGQELAARMWFIQAQTRKKYCKPKQNMEADTQLSQPNPSLSRSEVI